MEESIRSYTCSNCGGNLEWNIKKQRFECVSCRAPGEIDLTGEPICQHPLAYFSTVKNNDSEENIVDSIQCQNCGAEIIFTDNRTATVCPMCGSPQINIAKQNIGALPDGIIPFKIDRADAQEAFRKWAKGRWFAPNAFKTKYQEGKLEGVYLPCWTYDSDSEAHYSGRGGKTRVYKDKDGETHTETIWFPVSGFVAEHFDDLMVYDGNTDAKEVLADGNSFFNTEEDALPYLPPYISGFNAEHYLTGADACFERVKPAIDAQLRSKAQSDILSRGYNQAQVTSLNSTHKNVEYKNMLVPAWISAFMYKGKQYTYLISGESGKVMGKRPYSPIKIALLIIAILAVAVGAYFLLRDDPKQQKQTAMAEMTAPKMIQVEMAEMQHFDGPLFTSDGQYEMGWPSAA